MRDGSGPGCGERGPQVRGRVGSPPATRPGAAGEIRRRARSGAGPGRAGEGAGKLEQLRKVPKIPGGGGAGGGGTGNDAAATPPAREGRPVGTGLWAPAASAGRGAAGPREAPVGRAPLLSPGQVPGTPGSFKAWEGSWTRDVARLPPPSPPLRWSNPGIFLPKGRPRLIHPGAFGGTFLLQKGLLPEGL